MTDRDGERISGVGAGVAAGGEKPSHHKSDLGFVGLTFADNSFLNSRGGVFRGQEARAGDRHHGRASGLAEGKGGAGIGVDEGFFDCGLVGSVRADDRLQADTDGGEAFAKTLLWVGRDHAMGDVGEASAFADDETPTAAVKAWIHAQNAPSCLHALGLAGGRLRQV